MSAAGFEPEFWRLRLIAKQVVATLVSDRIPCLSSVFTFHHALMKKTRYQTVYTIIFSNGDDYQPDFSKLAELVLGGLLAVTSSAPIEDEDWGLLTGLLRLVTFFCLAAIA